jgi:hypothetical protein
VTPPYRRRMTQRRVAWRPKAATDIWRSEMTKGNWVSGPNVRLNRSVDCAGEKNMDEYEMI